MRFVKAGDGQNATFWSTNVLYCVPNVGTADGKGGSDVWGPGIRPLLLGGNNGPIFGYIGAGQGPYKISEINSVRSLADVWALGDTDQQAYGSDPWGTLPKLPLHGNLRNYLFLDGHAATRKVVKGYW
jgi:prepilin-type processing-associated H-X9-DG protein